MWRGVGVCVVGFCNVNSYRWLMDELRVRRVNHVHEAVELIYPVVEVILWVRLVSGLRFMARESVGSMEGSRYVNKGEMECENGHDPAVDTR